MDKSLKGKKVAVRGPGRFFDAIMGKAGKGISQ